MAEDAVSCELLSLLTAILTGDFHEFSAQDTHPNLDRRATYARIPAPILRSEQGISGNHGNSKFDHFSRKVMGETLADRSLDRHLASSRARSERR